MTADTMTAEERRARLGRVYALLLAPGRGRRVRRPPARPPARRRLPRLRSMVDARAALAAILPQLDRGDVNRQPDGLTPPANTGPCVRFTPTAGSATSACRSAAIPASVAAQPAAW